MSIGTSSSTTYARAGHVYDINNYLQYTDNTSLLAADKFYITGSGTSAKINFKQGPDLNITLWTSSDKGAGPSKLLYVGNYYTRKMLVADLLTTGSSYKPYNGAFNNLSTGYVFNINPANYSGTTFTDYRNFATGFYSSSSSSMTYAHQGLVQANPSKTQISGHSMAFTNGGSVYTVGSPSAVTFQGYYYSSTYGMQMVFKKADKSKKYKATVICYASLCNIPKFDSASYLTTSGIKFYASMFTSDTVGSYIIPDQTSYAAQLASTSEIKNSISESIDFSKVSFVLCTDTSGSQPSFVQYDDLCSRGFYTDSSCSTTLKSYIESKLTTSIATDNYWYVASGSNTITEAEKTTGLEQYIAICPFMLTDGYSSVSQVLATIFTKAAFGVYFTEV